MDGLKAGIYAGIFVLITCLGAGVYTLYTKVGTLEKEKGELSEKLKTSADTNASLKSQLQVQQLVEEGFAQLAGNLNEIKQNVGKTTEVKTNVIREIIKTDSCSQSRVPSGAECVLKPSLCANPNTVRLGGASSGATP